MERMREATVTHLENIEAVKDIERRLFFNYVALVESNISQYN